MPLTHLLTKLERDYPIFHFKPSDDFRWSPSESTIFYEENSEDEASLLHELAHGLLAHTDYLKDISLLEIERDAWRYAVETLSSKYTVLISEDTVQDSLDTYRDWLHARSVCPECSATGLQMKLNIYKCIACGTLWRVNDARSCALRRYKTKNSP